MEGKVTVSGELRLKNSIIGNDDTTTTTDDSNSKTVQDNISKLVTLAAGDTGLIHLREDRGNLDLLQTFINYCLFHFCTSMNWRYKAYSTLISDIFTDSDEALCMLLIENNASDYVKVMNEKTKIPRKFAQPKYTKMDNTSNKFKGWNRKGIQRFNVLVRAVKVSRESSCSKEMEIELKSRYQIISGRNINNENYDSDDSESDDSGDDDMQAYDGFAGVIQTRGSTSVTSE